MGNKIGKKICRKIGREIGKKNCRKIDTCDFRPTHGPPSAPPSSKSVSEPNRKVHGKLGIIAKLQENCILCHPWAPRRSGAETTPRNFGGRKKIQHTGPWC